MLKFLIRFFLKYNITFNELVTINYLINKSYYEMGL